MLPINDSRETLIKFSISTSRVENSLARGTGLNCWGLDLVA
jgi:hypothetical protein